ncbi:MAG: sensor histidine kinase [Flavobacteriales bacterium]|nr:sensor histidine kinase [Flavobacteriales bacterium]
MKLTLLQKQALRATLLSLIAIIAISFIFYFTMEPTPINLTLVGIVYFILLFLIYWFQMRRFIVIQLNKVYESNLFDNEPSIKKDQKDLDFEKFINRIKNFAENKHQEIEQLHNRDDFRRDFIGDVAHELKTPIFTAQGYLLTILDDSLDDPVLVNKYLERTNKSIERLSYIVKDLDMIANLESGMKLEQDNFNIVKTLIDVFDLFELKASKKNIKIDFKEPYKFPLLVKADKDKIEQVIINLLSNSIKYGKVGGSTLVSIENHSVHQLVVKIQDNGLGIEEKNLPRLFERFYRVEKSRSRDQGGSGLGLAIVKHIVEAHDQEVFVESKIGKGSVFSFTLNKAT